MKLAYQKPEIRKYPLKLQKVVAGSVSPPVESDRRLKRDITALGRLADGTKLYSFRYLWSETTYVGVMAQDLLDDPDRADAVVTLPNGYLGVDYGRLGLNMVTL